MKKFISLLLCFCLLIPFGMMAQAYDVEEAVPEKIEKIENAENKNPVIVVRGMDFSTGLMYDRGTPDQRYVHMEVSAKGVFSTLAKALSTLIVKGKDAAVDVICDFVAGMLEGYSCDSNGDSKYKNITSESYPAAAGNYYDDLKSYYEGEKGLTHSLMDRYGGERVYYFVYDWRLDPFDNCDDLAVMVDRALKENNKEKADIICCSMGGSVALAYIAEYGTSKIDTLISNSSVMGGTDVITDLFQGKAYFEPLAVENKLKDAVPALGGLITVMSRTHVLDKLCEMVNNFVEKYKRKVYDKTLTSTLATLPAYWSMVYADQYETCKNFVFGGKEDQYAGLIARMDNLYENLISKRYELIENACADGVKMVFIANYDTPLICAYERASYQGDGVVDTRPMALGATVSKVGLELTPEELSMGDPKYISADKCINASTCLLPDYTWFGKGAGHVVDHYGSDYTYFFFKLLESEVQPTIDMWEEYPQFMQSDKAENLSPLKAQ